jgi:hypothetical protein
MTNGIYLQLMKEPRKLDLCRYKDGYTFVNRVSCFLMHPVRLLTRSGRAVDAHTVLLNALLEKGK